MYVSVKREKHASDDRIHKSQDFYEIVNHNRELKAAEIIHKPRGACCQFALMVLRGYTGWTKKGERACFKTRERGPDHFDSLKRLTKSYC